VTRKLPVPALVSTDELESVPTSAQLAQRFTPTLRRPVTIVALVTVVIALAFVASRISGPPTALPPSPVVESAPPPVIPPIEPVATGPAVAAPEPADELAPVAQLPKVEEPQAKPAVARPAEPRFSCEPTPEWKAIMRGNLEALEGVGNALEPVVLLAEIGKVGRAVNEATTVKDCARVSAMYEALHKRAVK
jgi:hypothetical protein